MTVVCFVVGITRRHLSILKLKVPDACLNTYMSRDVTECFWTAAYERIPRYGTHCNTLTNTSTLSLQHSLTRMISHSLLVKILPIYLSLFGLSANRNSAFFLWNGFVTSSSCSSLLISMFVFDSS